MNDRQPAVAAARGDAPFDLVIRGAMVVNVYTLETTQADVGIVADRIACVDDGAKWQLEGREILEATGLTMIPGLIDTHVHIESSMVTPAEFARGVLPFGTTTVVIDPHEICNVIGIEGFEYMLSASQDLPLRVYLTVPSSVPAVPHLESSGANFEADTIAQLLEHPRVVGVAELMDYPGIIAQQARSRSIVEAGLASGKRLEGHAPLVRERDLMAYMAAGVDSDHECRSSEEMLEKLRAGMWVYGRENTFRHTVGFLAQALKTVPHAYTAALCTDDTAPDDLLKNGHLNRGLRILLEHGVPLEMAVRIATLNAATRFGLTDLGAIAAGKLADVLLFDNLTDTHPKYVLTGGRIQAKDGVFIGQLPSTQAPIQNTMRMQNWQPRDLLFRLETTQSGRYTVPILEIDAIRTTHLAQLELTTKDGLLELPLPEGVLLLCVVPRHGQTHRPSVALLRGLGLTRGALATTIAHDSHNLLIAGTNPDDMHLAMETVRTMQGGAALVADRTVQARVALAVGGLMSDQPISGVAEEVAAFNRIARDFGLLGASPILAISSLALTVAPFYRITDLGLVDTLKQDWVR